MASIKFADGRVATDAELESIAIAFGFSSFGHMRREFLAADRHRSAWLTGTGGVRPDEMAS